MSGGADFWSRRKARVEAEAALEARAAEARAEAALDAEREARSDEELLAELGLPEPETLGPGDDFRAFMKRAVPERLRRRALRRLWLSNPTLANLDGMIDYGEDYTDSAKVIANLKTAYQVGKGMLAHVEEMARQAEAAERVQAGRDVPASGMQAPETTSAAAQQPAAPDPGPDPAPAEAWADVEAAPPEPEETAEAEMPPPRRRMRFRFADQAGVSA